MTKKGSANPTRKSHSKEKSVKTSAFIEKVQELISENPGLSLTKLAKTLGVITMRRIAEEATFQILCNKSSTNALRDCQNENCSL